MNVCLSAIDEDGQKQMSAPEGNISAFNNKQQTAYFGRLIGFLCHGACLVRILAGIF